MTQPYVSVAFVNRNDGYGGDLEQRIAKFIEYYARYAREWPGLIEFVICDWNPPAHKAKLRDAFAWDGLGDVVHVEVPPALHQKVSGGRGRPMLDYIGRNVAIRRGRGRFSLVLNQDIFLSDSLMRLIARRALSERHFYRADRCDFDFTPCRDLPAAQFEAAALGAMFQVHRRHHAGGEPISVPATGATVLTLGSQAEAGDRTDAESGVIFCSAASAALQEDRRRSSAWAGQPWRRPWMRRWREEYVQHWYYARFNLHTNAAGDFILAPRRAFDDIQGMYETTAFYLHLDGYAIVQLFAAGYEQAIFAQPHRVFHADHDRSARADFKETIDWQAHESFFSSMLRDERPCQLNDAQWGLADARL